MWFPRLEGHTPATRNQFVPENQLKKSGTELSTLSTLDRKKANFDHFEYKNNISSHFISTPYRRNQIQGRHKLIRANNLT